jgi:hypothetical protein
VTAPGPEQIARLPLWARRHIQKLTQENAELSDANRRLDGEQQQREDWHRHTMYTTEIYSVDGKWQTRRRYIAANNIEIEFDNGLYLKIYPDNDGFDDYATVMFDLHPREFGQQAALVPSAGNNLRIMKMARVADPGENSK